MSRQKPKTPSGAQARYLAWLFAERRVVDFERIPPTVSAAIRNGWLVECGKIGSAIQFEISPAGLFALERYLWSVRVNSPAHIFKVSLPE